jgi:hypothetical protein
MVVSWARVCDAETSIVGPAGELGAHADNKTNKIIASMIFVFMTFPIWIADSDKAANYVLREGTALKTSISSGLQTSFAGVNAVGTGLERYPAQRGYVGRHGDT